MRRRERRHGINERLLDSGFRASRCTRVHRVSCHARDAKHVPGRKTDVSDAQWLQRLHSYGLLRASFRPKGQIAELRSYVRQRERVLEYAGLAHPAYAKGLDGDECLPNCTTSSPTSPVPPACASSARSWPASATLQALATLRHYSCHSSAETIAKALTGSYRAEHLFALEQALEWQL